MTDTPRATPAPLRPLTPAVERGIVAVLALLAGLSLAGLVTGMLGVFGVGPVLILGTAAGYTLWSLWGTPASETGRSAPPARVALLVALLVVVGSGYFASGRAFADGPDAAHAITAVGLSGSGNLTIAGPGDAFADGGGLAWDAPGFVSSGGDGRTVDGPRLFTSLAAAAAWVGPAAMFRLGAVLAGIAVFLWYALAVRWLRPATAAAVTLALAACPLLLLAARDTDPVALTLVLTLGGLWALDVAGDDEVGFGKAVVAGVLLGGAAASSDGGWVVLFAVAMYLAIVEIGGRGEGWIVRHRRRRFAGAVAAGAALPVVVALADAALTGRLGTVLTRAGALAVPALIVVVANALHVRRIAVRRPAGRVPMAIVVALVVLMAGYVLLLRPQRVDVGAEAVPDVAAAQAAEGLPVEPTRTYVEASGTWLWWYAPGILLIGLAGWTALAAVDVGGRRRPTLRLPVVVTGASLALVIAAPGVGPLQPGAGYAFLPLAIPGLLVTAGWVVERLFSDPDRYIVQTAAVVLLAGLVAPGVWRTADVWNRQPQAGAYPAVAEVCDALEPDDLVVVVGPDRSFAAGMAPAIAGFCGATTGVLAPGATAVPEAASASDRVVLVTAEPQPFGPAGPRARRLTDLELVRLRPTVATFPQATTTDRWTVGIVPVG